MTTIVHCTHSWGGGTQKYVDDMCKLYPEYEHIVVNKIPYQLDIRKAQILHIHSSMLGENIGWEIINVAKLFKKIILTVHDYQWIFPWCPNPTTEDFETFNNLHNVEKFKILFKMCDKVYIHTYNTLKRYEQFCGTLIDNYIIKHPPDTLIMYTNNVINNISEKIKIGFLGGTSSHKGFYHFSDLARTCKEEYEFHMYGADSFSKNFISHGKYKDETIIEQLHKDGIHILLALSLSEETYCYALTKMINSGLPILFFNRGSFTERLFNKHERFFEVDSFCNLRKRLEDVVNYVKKNGPIYNYEPVSNKLASNIEKDMYNFLF